MPKITQIICDLCGADITTVDTLQYEHRLRLSMDTHNKPASAAPFYAPIGYDRYFCNLLCLGVWVTQFVNNENIRQHKEKDEP